MWFVSTVHNKHIKQSSSWAVVNISKQWYSNNTHHQGCPRKQTCRNWSLSAFKNPLHHGTNTVFSSLFQTSFFSIPFLISINSPVTHTYFLYIHQVNSLTFSHFRWDGCDYVTSLLKLKLTWHSSSFTSESNLTSKLLPCSRNSKLQFNKSSLLSSE